MNDIGADKSIDQAAKDLNQLDGPTADVRGKHEQEAFERQQSDYKDPSLWWFASTGAPLMAGAFGPLASAFNICALVSSWRTYLTSADEITGTDISDPPWVLAMNGVSLAFALVANMALLLNMAQRGRFRTTQAISNIGFAIAGILLLALIIAFSASPTYHLPTSSPAAPSAHHALTGAFYYAIEATILYLIMTALMTLTSWGVWRKHFKGGFRLTIAQRTLMLQTMFFVIYLMIAAIIYSHLEGWEYLDALYFCELTLLTIGLGSDYSPDTHAGRSLLFFFAIGGIVIIGLVIGSIRTLILDRGARKLSARILEKRRMRAINSIHPTRQRIRVGTFRTMRFDNDELNKPKRRELEFNVMRHVQSHAERERKYMALAISSTAAAALWFLGAVVFWQSEKFHQSWSYFDALYFCYVCLLTIGYGDLYPKSGSGKAFFVIWTLLAVPTLTILISDMSDTVISTFSDLTNWVGSIAVLPGDSGFRSTMKTALKQFSIGHLDIKELNKDTVPGALEGAANPHHEEKDDSKVIGLVGDITERLSSHLEEEELAEAVEAEEHGNTLQRDIHFYHVVLAREIRLLMQDLVASEPKQYSWQDWEYFLKLMNNADPKNGKDKNLVPKPLRESNEVAEFKTEGKNIQNFTWLGEDSPLLSYSSETEWILERLGTTLERELQYMHKYMRNGFQDARRPPVSLSEMLRSGAFKKIRSRSRSKSTTSSTVNDNDDAGSARDDLEAARVDAKERADRS